VTTQPVDVAAPVTEVVNGYWTSPPGDALGHHFRVRAESTDPALLGRLAAVVSPLAAPVEPAFTYTVATTGPNRYMLSCDGDPICVDRTPGMTVRHLAWHINRSAVAAARTRNTVLHAAAARRPGCTVVLPAPMGRGKTTTVAGLLVQGWDYVTDEAVAVRREDLRITGLPKALSLDPGSWTLFPEARPSWPDADGDRQWQVPAHVLGARHSPAPADPAMVLMPRFTGAGRTHAQAVTPADAVTRLARCTFGFPSGGTDDLEVLVRMTRSCRVYSLEIADLASAVQLIAELAEEVV
jgi:hypothetical protein